MMNAEPTRIFDLLEVISSRPGSETTFSSLCNDKWREYTVSDYINYANRTSYALLQAGVRKGDTVLTISHNRAEFNFADMGIMQIGAIHFPLYQAIELNKLEGILRETGAKIAFISNKWILKKIRQVKSCPLEVIVSFDSTEGALFYEDFLNSATENLQMLNGLKSAVLPADPASIIYLSGANTPLRGVVLSHEAHVFSFLSYCISDRFSGCNQNLSFLPLAHCLERTANYIFQYLGIKVCYTEGITSVLALVKEVKPEAMIVVPLMLDKAIEIAQNEILKKPGIPGRISRRAYTLALKETASNQNSRFSVKRLLFRLALKDIRQVLGGNIRSVVCGGAALRAEVLNLLWAAGLNIYEGYGLTEAGPLVSFNHHNGFRTLSVGQPMPGVEVKIASDQEVLVKSRGLMTGYYKQDLSPIDNEGWLHTGDVGHLDQQGFLRLTGIKKDLFKVSSGLYMDPRPIEKAICLSGFIQQAWVYGHNRSFLVALIVPSAGEHENAHERELMDRRIGETISDYNSSCYIYDKVIKYQVVEGDWTLANGVLYADGNLNRQALFESNRDLIESLYS